MADSKPAALAVSAAAPFTLVLGLLVIGVTQRSGSAVLSSALLSLAGFAAARVLRAPAER
jgi:hypothetical protein